MRRGANAETVVRVINCRTRCPFSATDKIRIVLESMRSKESVAELCRCEGLPPNLYYGWIKEFPEAGKKRLRGDPTVGAQR